MGWGQPFRFFFFRLRPLDLLPAGLRCFKVVGWERFSAQAAQVQ